MLLSVAKVAIDNGKTAKLQFDGERVIVTVLIKKVVHEDIDCYAWQCETSGERAYPEVEPVNTNFFPTWGQLLEAIEGEQTETRDWQITDDPLRPYLPAERKVAP